MTDTTKSGHKLTKEMLEDLAAEAEHGYDPEKLRARMPEYLQRLQDARARFGNPSLRKIAAATAVSHTHAATIFNGQAPGSTMVIKMLAEYLCEPDEAAAITAAHIEFTAGTAKPSHWEPRETDGDKIAAAIREGLADIARAIRSLQP